MKINKNKISEAERKHNTIKAWCIKKQQALEIEM
jgi:hypothetical protein